jgi:hypothetical protein
VVTLRRQGPKLTRVDVSARSGRADWDKDFSKRLNEQINQTIAKG